MTPLENPLPLECILKIKENQKHCKGGATRAQNFIHPSYQYIHTLLTTPGDIFGDSSIRIPDPWEKSTSKKMFGIVFSLVTSKKDHSRGWSKVARALVLSQCTLLLPKSTLLFPEYPFSCPEVSFCFLELPLCFPELPFSKLLVFLISLKPLHGV